MNEHRILHQTVPVEPPPSDGFVQRYREDIARFRRRKGWALAVSIVCHVAAVVLIAMGAALVLGSQNTIAGHWLAERHPPGDDGSISLTEPGLYAITRTNEPAPTCAVSTTDGLPVTLTQDNVPRSNVQVPVFEATQGGYTVLCEGGNDGVVVFAMDQMDVVANGWLAMFLRALPFIGLGLVAFFAGRILPRRIAPESMRPMIPN